MGTRIENGKRDWKTPDFEHFHPTEIDWARMAAFIDGEGSILINTRKSARYSSEAAGFYLRITVANTDTNLILWLLETFGGGFHESNSDRYKKRIPNAKDCYHWNTGSTQAAWILYNCLPYFIIKKVQAEIGIQLQESMNKFTRGPGRYLPDEIREERLELKRRLLILKAKGRGFVKPSIQGEI